MTTLKHPLRIALTTLGCKVNQCDGAAISRDLQGEAFISVRFSDVADIYIINTCTVTAYADVQARQLIRRAKRANPHAKVIVTGCMAQVHPADVAAIDGVTAVVGNDHKHRIAEMIREEDLETCRIHTGGEIDIHHTQAARPASRTRAFLKVQDGCEAFCSYCLVPFARGKSRSLPALDLRAGVLRLRDAGYREIVLTGIHLGRYGLDLNPQVNLVSALNEVLSLVPKVRFRLSSIEPNEITDDLLNLFSRHENLCPHLHIPLQSGDDDILKSMKRHYDAAHYREVICKVAAAVSDITIGTDVMVGFPGEGTQAFEQTLKLLTDLPVAYLHVFPYSERPKTEAIHLHPKVPEKIKKERAAILRELGAKKREAFSLRYIGRRLPVLVEHARDKKTGMLKGFSHNYLPVMLDTHDPARINHIVWATITSFGDGRLSGSVSNES